MSASHGQISAIRGGVLQIDAAVNPDNSGGPVLNDHDEVVSVVGSRLSPSYVLDATGQLAERINQAIDGDQALASFDAFVSACATSQKRDRQEIVAKASKAKVLIKTLSAEEVPTAPTPAASQPTADSTRPPELTKMLLLPLADPIRVQHLGRVFRFPQRLQLAAPCLTRLCGFEGCINRKLFKMNVSA